MLLQADRIFKGGPILTVDRRNTVASAVAIWGDRIVAVGTEEEMESLRGPGTRVTDLGGRALIPGLIENHAHLTNIAVQADEVDLNHRSGCTDIAEMVQRIRRRAATTPHGEWIVGGRYNHDLLAEGRHPTRWDLNEATRDHPVGVAHQSGHSWVFNDMGLERLGVREDTPEEAGDWMPRDAQGRLTGALGENCRLKYINPVLNAYDADTLSDQLERSQRFWNSLGFTSANDAGTAHAAEVAAWNLVHRRGKSSLRVQFMVRDDLVPKLQAFGALSGFGDEWVRIGCLKMGIDGAQLLHTCAMSEEWPDQPGFHGTLRITREAAEEFAMTGQRLGYHMTGHAIGDVAIDIILNAFEKAMRAYPRPGLRHRIEHACFPRPEHLETMKRLAVSANTQSGFLEYAGKTLQDCLGPERMYYYLPYRSYIDAGIVVSGGSDAPCIHPDPMWSMHALVTRRLDWGRGDPVAPHQAISMMEALRVFTWNGAYTRNDEEAIGSIEPGKFADLVVLDRDISRIRPEELRETKVLATIVGGKTVYGDV